ncbi:hydrolase [Paractinoplanes deccanensis]|uniref:Hydrolase n=1 Tax=Paractinoplanes deccanensis TaxID=113561 RepID=A0ABQ3YF12_9ACTN|nr:HIT family protein [Actinoplanes deccanensis]GID78581.1 hydrolase [Actinoplanes deccanensis]
MADCLFCGIVAGTVPAFKVADTPDGVGFLDIRPVFKGHVLVVPREHVVTLPDLPAALLPGYFGLVQAIAAAVPAALGSTGTFVANNNIVSQSVAHLHFHVVPRTKGDGLRGFFWPRHRYDSDEEAAGFAASIAAALAGKDGLPSGVAQTG